MNDFVDKNTNHEPIDILPYVQRCALDIILETAMGVESDIQDNRESDYANCVERAWHILQQRYIYPWYMVCLPALYLCL